MAVGHCRLALLCATEGFCGLGQGGADVLEEVFRGLVGGGVDATEEIGRGVGVLSIVKIERRVLGGGLGGVVVGKLGGGDVAVPVGVPIVGEGT